MFDCKSNISDKEDALICVVHFIKENPSEASGAIERIKTENYPPLPKVASAKNMDPVSLLIAIVNILGKKLMINVLDGLLNLPWIDGEALFEALIIPYRMVDEKEAKSLLRKMIDCDQEINNLNQLQAMLDCFRKYFDRKSTYHFFSLAVCENVLPELEETMYSLMTKSTSYMSEFKISYAYGSAKIKNFHDHCLLTSYIPTDSYGSLLKGARWDSDEVLPGMNYASEIGYAFTVFRLMFTLRVFAGPLPANFISSDYETIQNMFALIPSPEYGALNFHINLFSHHCRGIFEMLFLYGNLAKLYDSEKELAEEREKLIDRCHFGTKIFAFLQAVFTPKRKNFVAILVKIEPAIKDFFIALIRKLAKQFEFDSTQLKEIVTGGQWLLKTFFAKPVKCAPCADTRGRRKIMIGLLEELNRKLYIMTGSKIIDPPKPFLFGTKGNNKPKPEVREKPYIPYQKTTPQRVEPSAPFLDQFPSSARSCTHERGVFSG